MKNNPLRNTVISPTGEKQLLRAAQIASFLSDLLEANVISGSHHVSSEGMAAVMECLAEQVEQVITESSLMNKDIT
ncbi:hypothetical protein ACN3ZE_003836 [Providencia rettgeri]|uniref:hypothetical protein n=1 Tax=Providencia TaxID=586 RepID=UPI001B36CEDA|nr:MULTISPECIES: hypothetical protein [Providencia]EHZ7764588.1 hypothetical protein [Providencia rettgeri]EIJ7167730.1 hypothetical protein [Providencia rettgeri]ELR5093181.1 hypothetical protein [Providencia rettgeri]ELR5105423.1 hypothetical protein [Providencia rettgeri]MBQ0608476.1 hypothetical protein [Providencia rettgeri]